MATKQKYLKDENGEVFSPIVSVESVYNGNNNLKTILQNEEHITVLQSETTQISGANQNYYYISLSDDYTNYDFIIFFYGQSFAECTPYIIPVSHTKALSITYSISCYALSTYYCIGNMELATSTKQIKVRTRELVGWENSYVLTVLGVKLNSLN